MKASSHITKIPVQGVKKIICVAAGKGGVGKSTISVNLAAALNKLGLTTALVDADIFGPSIPLMMGIKDYPNINNKFMDPVIISNIQTMSLGYLVDSEKAAIWRGPMVTKTLFQLIRSTKWKNVDVMIIDMPPGTGDVALSLVEQYPIDGFVIVTTPQKIALADVQKAIAMCNRTNQKILGIVENMSYYEDKDGHRTHILGESELENFCSKNNTKILAKFKMDPKLAASCNTGTIYVESDDYDTDNIMNFKLLAENVIESIE